jgi:cytochrome c oxidase cbb3-type subunit 4
MEWMQSAMTVITFVTFLGIVAWAWSARKRADFEAAANSVLLEDDVEKCNKNNSLGDK